MLWFHPYSLFTVYPSSFWTCGSNPVLDAILSPADIADPFPSPTLDYCLFDLFIFLTCDSILPSPTETLPRHAESPCVSMGLWVLKGYGLRHSMLLHQRHFCEEVKSKGFVLCPGPRSSLQDMERSSKLFHTSDGSTYVSAYYVKQKTWSIL